MRPAVLVAAIALAGACRHDPAPVSVGVAASLRNVMPELVDRYHASSGVRIEAVYGASGTLAARVTRGDGLDALILAEAAALDELVAVGTVAADSRRALATTSIVLVGPAGATLDFAGLAGMPADVKIAIGDPASVPAGRYARVYLQQLGIWSAVEPHLLLGGDVAAVLALALRGEARVAIVYRTDAIRAAPLVILDQPTDGPIVDLVAGVVAASPHAAAARDFLDFLASPDGGAILARHGFAPVAPEPPSKNL